MKFRLRVLFRPALVVALGLACAQAEEALPPKVEFNRDIRPIFSDICFQCHGPDKAKRKADLRLDLEESAKARHDDIVPIVPGHPGKSEVIARITTSDPDDHMPPPDFARQLTPRQVELIRRWVEQGAAWQPHWSFIPPVRPEAPRVKDAPWVRNPVDAFVLARLEREGLAPSPEADRATLIRRVSFDLTGLPPTPAEGDAFLADSSPAAYERVVDRLLASPHFGERMASRWMDAARYADTNGYQSDGERSMWRWRDWVIDAFNRNLPFDRFTIEQLAGDLLPDATRDQRIATGFNRNHRGNAEGGIIPEEYAAEYVVDRVDTTCTVWLGLTVGCARCHDHKYDPFSQREFYQLFAIFNNVPEKGRAIKIGNSPPYLTAPTPAQERELTRVEGELAAAEARLRELEPQIAAGQKAWEATLAEGADWTVVRGLQAHFETAKQGGDPRVRFEDGAPFIAHGGGRANSSAIFDGTRFLSCGDVGDFGFFDKFSLTAWIQSGREGGAIVSRMVESPEDSAFASDSEGYCVFLKDGHLQFRATKRWLDDALRVETVNAIPAGAWHHVAAVYDGSRLAAGVKLFIDGQPQKTRVLLDQLNQTFQTTQPLRIGAGGGAANRFHGSIDDVRVYSRALSDEETGIVATDKTLRELAAIVPDQRTAAASAKLRACFLAEHAPAPQREAHQRAVELREQRAKLVQSLPTVMVMEEMPQPRATFILKRGEYDKPGERVEPGVPASIAPFPASAPRNRLGFAKWLMSEQNPLTARVAVNQSWQMLFGTGLVKTAEDFGAQGEPPSHPDLLDWLATDFRTDWDVKRLLKTLVTSATYRQASRLTPALLTRDPDNRLLARGPRVRLAAEMVRDQALAASGLLVREIGGPSVKPYQPKGLWKDLSGTDYVPDHGDRLWRRSLYTFVKRTSPPPTMITFDASGREACSVRASRTSTPLQALALMNDVTFVEAARCLAERSLREADAPTAEARLTLAFRLVLTRAPKPAELQILLADLAHHQARFRENPAAAQELITAGEAPRDPNLPADELAAYTAVASLILNLDEAITKQ